MKEKLTYRQRSSEEGKYTFLTNESKLTEPARLLNVLHDINMD